MLRLIAIELILFCALFTMMVKTAVWNSALNGLYFYPEPVQERAFDIGLTDRDHLSAISSVVSLLGCQRSFCWRFRVLDTLLDRIC